MFARLLRGSYDPYESQARYAIDPRLAVLGGALGLFDDHYGHPRVHLNMAKPDPQTRSYDDKSNFQVLLNVKHFRPDEIDVKTVDNFVVIHGRHEEHADEHGLVSREFTRRYQLPDDVEPETVTTSLSQDGVLTIQAPRKQLEPPPKNERIVPIIIQQPAAVEDAQKHQQQMQEQAAAEACDNQN